MKITEDSIDYNAVRLIKDNALPFEMSEQNDDADHQRLITLGYIEGVVDMADAMRGVLRA